MERLIDAGQFRQDSAALLADCVLPHIQRACALVDLNPASATYGCADRTYWYYRTLTNFAGATWQQLMLALACVYRTDIPANLHYRDPQIAALTSALLAFWARSQHTDGAFDEWYLNEHSYCPTAITAAGAALTLHLMADDLAPDARKAGMAALERAGHWLEPRYNAEVMNQNLAAAAALQGLATLLPESRWTSVARAKLELVRREQTREGWFPEYGGMDFGYSTLALDLLAACRLLGGDAVIDEMAARLSRFLVDARGAGRVAPGRLGSRGTSHAFAFGALYFAASDAAAARLAQTLLAGVARQAVATPQTVDDRYFAYFYLPQFALALFRAAGSAPSAAPAAEPVARSDLRESGLAVVRQDHWSITVSRRLGGALAIETEAQVPFYHLGYEVTTHAGRRYSSAAWLPADVEPFAERGTIVARGEFRAVSSGLPLRRLMVPFQMVLYLLRTSGLAAMFQALIKRTMIAPDRRLPLRLERRVEAHPGGVVIEDTLAPAAGLGTLSTVQVAPGISMHSPSSRQEPGQSLHADAAVLARVCELLNQGSVVLLRWTWTPTTNAAGCQIQLTGAP